MLLGLWHLLSDRGMCQSIYSAIMSKSSTILAQNAVSKCSYSCRHVVHLSMLQGYLRLNESSSNIS